MRIHAVICNPACTTPDYCAYSQCYGSRLHYLGINQVILPYIFIYATADVK